MLQGAITAIKNHVFQQNIHSQQEIRRQGIALIVVFILRIRLQVKNKDDNDPTSQLLGP